MKVIRKWIAGPVAFCLDLQDPWSESAGSSTNDGFQRVERFHHFPNESERKPDLHPQPRHTHRENWWLSCLLLSVRSASHAITQKSGPSAFFAALLRATALSLHKNFNAIELQRKMTLYSICILSVPFFKVSFENYCLKLNPAFIGTFLQSWEYGVKITVKLPLINGNCLTRKSSTDSSVSIVTRLRTGRPKFDSRKRQGLFLLAAASRPDLGPTQPPIQWIPEALSLGLRRPGREAGHSPTSSAKVKNAYS
jgi:hypothetical protein